MRQSLAVLLLVLAAAPARATIIAQTSFEGTAGELPWSYEVTEGWGIAKEVPYAPRTGDQNLLLENLFNATFQVTFEPVDLTLWEDVTVSLAWRSVDGHFDDPPQKDHIKAVVTHDGSGQTALIMDVTGAENLNIITYKLETGIIPDDATIATLLIDQAGSGIIEDIYIDDVSFEGTLVPEPSGLVLFSLGILTLAGYAWRRSRKAR